MRRGFRFHRQNIFIPKRVFTHNTANDAALFFLLFSKAFLSGKRALAVWLQIIQSLKSFHVVVFPTIRELRGLRGNNVRHWRNELYFPSLPPSPYSKQFYVFLCVGVCVTDKVCSFTARRSHCETSWDWTCRQGIVCEWIRGNVDMAASVSVRSVFVSLWVLGVGLQGLVFMN